MSVILSRPQCVKSELRTSRELCAWFTVCTFFDSSSSGCQGHNITAVFPGLAISIVYLEDGLDCPRPQCMCKFRRILCNYETSWSRGSLMFMIGNPLLVRRCVYFEQTPGFLWIRGLFPLCVKAAFLPLNDTAYALLNWTNSAKSYTYSKSILQLVFCAMPLNCTYWRFFVMFGRLTNYDP